MKFLFFAIFLFYIECKTEKEVLIFAENLYDFGGSLNIKFYSDSTYEFSVFHTETYYKKIESYFGNFNLNKDTIYFKPFNFTLIDAPKAILKNNFIEFLDGIKASKIKIKKTKLTIKQTIENNKLKNFSIFTYNNKLHHYFEGEVKSYEITASDLVVLDNVLKHFIEENKAKIRKEASEYFKQIIPVINLNNEIEVWVVLSCYNKNLLDQYESGIIEMDDGGYCHFRLKINITKKKIPI